MSELPMTPDGYIDYGRIFAPGWDRTNESGKTSCGPGSLPSNTLNVQSKLAQIVADFNVTSINNVGCGDMAWMAPFLQARNVRHVGYDVVHWPAWDELEDYDLRVQDCTRQPLDAADLTVVRDVCLHLNNEPVQAMLRNCFRSSRLVFATSFVIGATKELFTNDAEERAQRFRGPRGHLNHAMFDLDAPGFSLVSLAEYTASENYPGKVMRLYASEDQTATFLGSPA